jgi:hypothetical protein
MYDLYKLTRKDAPDSLPTYWAIGADKVVKFVVEGREEMTEHVETGWRRAEWHRIEVEDMMQNSVLGVEAKFLGKYETWAACRNEVRR